MNDAPTPAELPQLNRADVARLAKDPGALNKAYVDGRLSELLSGREPGACPTCRRPMSDG